jgi:hypothetical protein
MNGFVRSRATPCLSSGAWTLVAIALYGQVARQVQVGLLPGV